MRELALLLAPLALLSVAIPAPAQTADPTSEVVLASEVDWQPLNPARGDKSPRAATLWGDRNDTVPTGFLVAFVDGFSSPPHIHNVSYRGVVISGLVHNDDPDAAHMWMPAGSFWTQPKGEVHITAAKGGSNVAYIEIDEGPYLVRPADDAFDSGERPINVDPSNLVWLDASSGIGPEDSADGPKIAFLWGSPEDDQLNGTFLELPAGFAGEIRSNGSTFRAVLIQGRPEYEAPGEADAKILEPGSYFGSSGESVHHVSSEAECIFYVRTVGGFDVMSAGPEK